ncbi:uncharacterized protein LOC131649940 [Vicia villosa]|uniref:uncharacterized protein LOC131649940 n=1 Tax=Vicia villosa TaxID=3911 RepID=UPI00273AC4BD|nr:uncharacterized protein LOC131649940 [Vicia villosa]
MEEKWIFKLWRRGVIVKPLGRRIRYKALQTRLKQVWVRKGVFNIIDMGNDYYLVIFSHDDNYNAALMDVPWFIYDHYPTIKELSPIFQPMSETIEKVVVWVHMVGLPIEYYDSHLLSFIGNQIGNIVKLDKNTLMQERGKYACLCVEENDGLPIPNNEGNNESLRKEGTKKFQFISSKRKNNVTITVKNMNDVVGESSGEVKGLANKHAVEEGPHGNDMECAISGGKGIKKGVIRKEKKDKRMATCV